MKNSFFKWVVTYGLTVGLFFSAVRVFEDVQPAKAQVAGGVLILGCLTIGACIIIKAMHKPDALIDRVLVLQVNLRDGNGWSDVVTNYHAVLYCDNPTSIFAVQMHLVNNEAAQFRVHDVTDWYRETYPYPYMVQAETRVILPNGDTATSDPITARYLADEFGCSTFQTGLVQDYAPAP